MSIKCTYRLLFFPVLLGGLFLLASAPAVHAAGSWPANEGAVFADDTELGVAFEPSGAVWHTRLEELLVVSDEGVLAQLDGEGALTDMWTLSGDFEGVTVADADSSYVYIGIERPDSIIEFDFATGELTGRSWDLTTWMGSSSENQGLEALTFVPNGVHPYDDSESGGLFYAGLQETGIIYVFDINVTTSESVTFVDTIVPISGQSDLAGLHYDADTETLYAVYDSANEFVVMQPSGTVTARYELLGNDQEGVTTVSDCETDTADIYIAEDVGPEVWSYGEYAISCVAEADEESSEESSEEEIPEEEDEGPDAEEPEIFITVGKRYLRTYAGEGGEMIDQQKLYKQKQYAVTSKQYQLLHTNTETTVVVLSQKQKKRREQLRLRSFTVDVQGTITRHSARSVYLQRKLKQFRSISIRKNNKQGKKARFFLKRNGKRINGYTYRVGAGGVLHRTK